MDNPNFMTLGEIEIGFNLFMRLSRRADYRYSLAQNRKTPSEGRDQVIFMKHAFIADRQNMFNLCWLMTKALSADAPDGSLERNAFDEVATIFEQLSPELDNKRKAKDGREIEFGYNRYAVISRLPGHRFSLVQNSYAPTADEPMPATLVRIQLDREKVIAIVWMVMHGMILEQDPYVSPEYFAAYAKIKDLLQKILTNVETLVIVS